MNHPKEVSNTKRTLLKAGWVAPLIVAFNLPASSFAANSSNQNGQGGNNQGGQGGNNQGGQRGNNQG